MAPRLDNFHGTVEEYVSHLERCLIDLRHRRPRCSACSTTPNRAESSILTAVPAFQPAQDNSVSCRNNGAPGEQISANGAPPPKRQRTLDFIPFEGAKVFKKKVAKQPNPDTRWKQHARALIQKTPKAQDWYAQLKEAGLYDMMRGGTAVALILNSDHQELTNDNLRDESNTSRLIELGGDCPEQSGALQQVEWFARHTLQLEKSAWVHSALANFRKFLVLSACAVLLSRHVSNQRIFEIVRLVMNIPEGTQKRCDDLVGTAQYMNRLLDMLYLGGFGLRGCEILLFWNRPPSFFYHLLCAPDSLNFFKIQLCNEEFIALRTVPPDDWYSIFVPDLVHRMLNRTVEVAEIASILGYQHADAFSSRPNLWQYQALLKIGQF